MRRQYIIRDGDGRAARLVIMHHGDAWCARVYLPLTGTGASVEDYGDAYVEHVVGAYEDVARRGFGVVQALLDRQASGACHVTA